MSLILSGFFSNNNYKEKYAYNMKSRNLIKRNVLCVFCVGKCKLRAKAVQVEGNGCVGSAMLSIVVQGR